jgi:hypothetical protein
MTMNVVVVFMQSSEAFHQLRQIIGVISSALSTQQELYHATFFARASEQLAPRRERMAKRRASRQLAI